MINNTTITTEFFTGLLSFKERLFQDEMFSSDYKNSYFLKLYKTPLENLEKIYTVSVACNSYNEIMVVIIFEHIKHDLSCFQYQKKKNQFQTIGRLMIYVKPKFRKQELAKYLINDFDKKLKSFIKNNHFKTNNTFFVINAVDKSNALCLKYLPNFVISETFKNSYMNKISVKDAIHYYHKKPTFG